MQYCLHEGDVGPAGCEHERQQKPRAARELRQGTIGERQTRQQCSGIQRERKPHARKPSGFKQT